MKAIFMNEVQGKTVTINNITDEGYEYKNSDGDETKIYFVKFIADENTDTIEKICKLFNFEVSKIEIHDMVLNEDTQEFEDVILRTITDVSVIYQAYSKIDKSSIVYNFESKDYDIKIINSIVFR